MRFLLMMFTIATVTLACEDEANNVAENPNIPSDEAIQIVASETGQSEAEVRAFYEECVSKGGKGIIGGFGQPACENTTPDAGKTCTQNSDCEGFCLAETKSCSAKAPLFGCTEVLPAPDEPATICVD